MEEMLGLGGQLAAALDRAAELGRRLPAESYRLSGAELAPLVAAVDRCRAVLEGDLYALTLEADGAANAEVEPPDRR